MDFCLSSWLNCSSKQIVIFLSIHAFLLKIYFEEGEIFDAISMELVDLTFSKPVHAHE